MMKCLHREQCKRINKVINMIVSGKEGARIVLSCIFAIRHFKNGSKMNFNAVKEIE